MAKIKLVNKNPERPLSVINLTGHVFKAGADGSFTVDEEYMSELRNHGLVTEEEFGALQRARRSVAQ